MLEHLSNSFNRKSNAQQKIFFQKLIEQQRYIKQSEVDSFVQKFELKMKFLS